MKSSFSAGGLSEVWGATLLPYQKKTIDAWGLPWADFTEAYQKVLSKIPYSTFEVNPSSIFQNFGNAGSLEISGMFKSAINLETDREVIEFGASRLGLQVSEKESSGCYYCNKCLGGCISGHIWSAAHLPRYKSINDSRSQSEVRVIKLEEKYGGIILHAITSTNDLIEIGPYSKVFLACGPIETFRILSSSDFLPKKTVLQDSPTFFFPLIYIGKKNKFSDNGIALSQAYCHIQGKKDKREYHFQFYGQSDILLERIISSVPFAKYFPIEFLRILMRRVVICIGYRESGEDTEITLIRDLDENLLCKDSYQISKLKLKRDLRKRLFLHFSQLWSAKFLFFGIGIKVGPAGEGIHYGANLTQDIEVTREGKLIATESVYVVDSSTLPSISAGPITLTIMANAYRIAKGALR
jgi:hypothetical protein